MSLTPDASFGPSLLGYCTIQKLCTESTYLQKGVLSYQSERARQIFIPNYSLKSKGNLVYQVELAIS